MIKFLFLEGIQGHVFVIIHQSFHNFIRQWNRGRNFLVENFVIFESKKFLSLGVCKLKFLFLEGI